MGERNNTKKNIRIIYRKMTGYITFINGILIREERNKDGSSGFPMMQ